MPQMDRETFVTLIKQQGLHFDEQHIDELLPDVQAMLGRVDTLFEAPTEGLEPGLLPPGGSNG